jgi:uncharacterized protein YjbI with pentapeptide repeats
MEIYFDQTFENLNSLEIAEFENCTFLNCDFSDADFSHYKFIDCEFQHCNLSLMKLVNTIIQTTSFSNCKMLGLKFSDCNLFGLSFSFEECNLNHCDFFKLEIPRTKFQYSQLQDADFSQCDLTSAEFVESDLKGTVFDQSNLEKADFRTASNYTIHPNMNRIKKAKFSNENLQGLLQQYDIKIEV